MIDTDEMREEARRLYYRGPNPSGPYDMLEQAADEIDRLRAQIESAKNVCSRFGGCIRD